MLISFIAILVLGFFGGQLARRLGIPALVGMILVGIFLGPELGNAIAPEVLAAAGPLRTVAVMVILMKAGLGLDRQKLSQQGIVALRLGVLPAACEAIALAIAAHFLFQFDWATGLLLGCIVGAESPAVIVPGMLRLKSLGWGVEKGIPDAILTGSALSDVLLLLVYSLLMTFLGQDDGGSAASLWWLPGQVVLQISLGIFVGWVAAHGLVSLLAKQNWTQTAVQDALVAASFALFLVVMAEHIPIFSGYLAVMATGFFLIELDAPLARRLRRGFDGLWTIAEVVLFVLLGASIQLTVIGGLFIPGLLILAIGLFLGRGIGWYLSTWGSNWTPSEKVFLLAGNSAKATVQAAIGAAPLAANIPGGDIILAIAALSILVTAPFGAWAIPTFAPRLLSRGEVDPTKVAIATSVVILAAVDTTPLAIPVLEKAAELARRSDGRVIVAHVQQVDDPAALEKLSAQIQRTLADIPHECHVVTGAIPEEILRLAQEYHSSEILIGKRGDRPNPFVGSISQSILETSSIPVMVVETQPSS